VNLQGLDQLQYLQLNECPIGDDALTLDSIISLIARQPDEKSGD